MRMQCRHKSVGLIGLGTILVALGLSACSKTPTLPEEQPAISTGTSQPSTDAEAERRRLEQLATIEEKERAVREESMRRGLGGAASAESLVITQEEFLQKDVQFDYDSFTLSEESKITLEQKTNWMVMNPNVSIRIEGHCDERGTIAYNLALGERRANTVKQYMVALGVDAKRIATISFGKEFPIDPGHTETAWARNRRAHFTIVTQ